MEVNWRRKWASPKEGLLAKWVSFLLLPLSPLTCVLDFSFLSPTPCPCPCPFSRNQGLGLSWDITPLRKASWNLNGVGGRAGSKNTHMAKCWVSQWWYCCDDTAVLLLIVGQTFSFPVPWFYHEENGISVCCISHFTHELETARVSTAEPWGFWLYSEQPFQEL